MSLFLLKGYSHPQLLLRAASLSHHWPIIFIIFTCPKAYFSHLKWTLFMARNGISFFPSKSDCWMTISKVIQSTQKSMHLGFLTGFFHSFIHRSFNHSDTDSYTERFLALLPCTGVVLGIFEAGSLQLFALAGFKPRSSWSLPPE
jgi:hypothetical protein